MSTSAKLASFRATIAKKVTAITYAENEFPSSPSDPLSQYLASSKIETNISNTYSIAVCPDFTPSFLFLLISAHRKRTEIQAANNAKVSVYTYVAYNLYLIYLWFMLHDLYINPGSCKLANDLLLEKHIVDALEDALEYPVPPEVTTVIAYWSITCLENQQNIWLTPSFSNYMHHTHFGRSFPILSMIAAHNTVASLPATASYPAALYKYGKTPLYTIEQFVANPFTSPNTKASVTITPDHYFSLLRPDSTDNSIPAPLDNKVNQILLAFLSFDSLKAMKAKSSFSHISFVAPSFASAQGHVNPYLMLTGLSDENTAELQTVFNAVKSVILHAKLANTNLSAQFTAIPQSGSANHGYSAMQFNHWDASPPTSIAKPVRDTTEVLNTSIATVQTAQGFLVPLPTHRTAANPSPSTLPWTQRVIELARPIADLVTTPAFNATAVRALITAATLRLRFTQPSQDALLVPLSTNDQTVDVYANNPAGNSIAFTELPLAQDTSDITDIGPDDADSFPVPGLTTFHKFKNVYPTVKVIMPQGFSVSAAPLVALRGMTIMSEDLTGSLVPQLQSDSEVYDDNAQFLQSAIPFALTHLATDMRTTSPVASLSTPVPALTAEIQPAVSLVRSHTHVFLPHLARNVYHLGLDTLSPGLTPLTTRQRIPLFSQTFIGHSVHARASSAAAHITNDLDTTPTGHLLLWSPYTFRAPTFQVKETTTVASALKATYYLSNLRTLFGTSQQVVSVSNPIHALPSV